MLGSFELACSDDLRSDDRISVRGDTRRAGSRASLRATSMVHRRCGFAAVGYFSGAAALSPRVSTAYFAANGYYNLGLTGAQIKICEAPMPAFVDAMKLGRHGTTGANAESRGDDPIATID